MFENIKKFILIILLWVYTHCNDLYTLFFGEPMIFSAVKLGLYLLASLLMVIFSLLDIFVVIPLAKVVDWILLYNDIDGVFTRCLYIFAGAIYLFYTIFKATSFYCIGYLWATPFHGLIFFIFLYSIFLLCVPYGYLDALNLSLSGLEILFLCVFVIGFDFGCGSVQFIERFNAPLSFLEVDFLFGLDFVSLLYIFLIVFVFLLCSLYIRIRHIPNKRLLYLLFIYLKFVLFFLFSSLDFTVFYLFLEATIPAMFLLIGIWGSRTRRVNAAYTYYLFSVFASIPMFISLLFLLNVFGSTNLFTLLLVDKSFLVDYESLLWFSFFFSLGVKLPLYPFHLWLPEAHGEASTVGSVILAGLFLKIGGYGIYRFLLPVFPLSTAYFRPFIYIISLLGIYYCSFILFRQLDLKKFVAYSSVIHMNFINFGLLSNSMVGISGALYSMYAHSLVSISLFFVVGMLYDRYKTRIVYYFSELAVGLPGFTAFFMFFFLSNCAFPITVGFIGELLVIFDLVLSDLIICILALCGLGLSALAHYVLFMRVFYVRQHLFLGSQADVIIEEFYILFCLVVFIFLFNLFAFFVLRLLDPCVSLLLAYMCSNTI